MNPHLLQRQFSRWACSVALLLTLVLHALGAAQTARVLDLEGTVTWQRSGTTNWLPAKVGLQLSAGDRLQTADRSRATVHFSDRSVERLFESSILTVEAPPPDAQAPSFFVELGRLFFKSAEKPRELRFRTRAVTAAIRGTEFHIQVTPSGQTILTLLDGEVELENNAGKLTLKAGEEATIEIGKAPEKTPAIYTQKRIQWCLYYPGVLDADELPMNAARRGLLAESLSAWRAGDLRRALAVWPEGVVPADDAERIYRAALLLGVGQVDQAEMLLEQAAKNLGADARIGALVRALRTLMAAVRFEGLATQSAPETASEALALSYWEQSQGRLKEALAAARQATSRSTNFGFAHARLAELEFGFARIPQARHALEQALRLAPANAQAVALRGFLAAAEGRLDPAEQSFNEAIMLDGALGNAWLGRGLVKIRRGQTASGRVDLQVAAALEPTRALLHAYLGKAFQVEGDRVHAARELALAKRLDAGDPTAWLYSALLARERGEVNLAVRDLEQSIWLNTNRSLFRSQLLLDQDRAVRGANLANVYRDAGMNDVALNEAARAVNADFANHSAHLFLANSYAVQREARQSDLRYETPALNELLLANLLAPPGSPVISSTISQQEYSRLFEQNFVGGFSGTEYRSSGDWSQTASQFGLHGGFSWSLNYSHASQNGDQPNGGFERNSFSAEIKQQLTARDSLFVQAIYARNRAGDLTSYYDPAAAKTGLRLKEVQEPTLLAGLHREWSPGNHTLLFAGRVEDQFDYSDPASSQLLLGRTAGGAVFAVGKPASPVSALDYSANFTLHTSELLQIFQRERHTLIFGARYQTGEFDTASQLSASTATRIGDEAGFIPPFPPITFATPATAQSQTVSFERRSLYYYHHWQIHDALRLVGGVVYDGVTFPDNHLFPPLLNTDSQRERVSPKAGFVWTPRERTSVRFGFSRAVSGVSFDQSFRLEPSEVAGFNQSFRSLIPDSVAGTTANAAFENFGLSLNQKFSTDTYLTLAAIRLTSDVNRRVGTFDLVLPPAVPSSTLQELRYREHTLLVALNQLLGEHWFAGARYELSDARLQDDYPEIPATVSAGAHTVRAAALNHAAMQLGFNHPSGFFARVETDWYAQSNRGFNAGLMPGDDFWQSNVHLGWRFPRRRAEVQVSLLNLTDQDYRLNPLNSYASLPRERTLAVRLKLAF